MAGRRQQWMSTVLRPSIRWVLALFYAFAGIMHLARPEPFLTIMPGGVPWPEAVVFWTGIAELLGAVGLVQPWSARLRRWAGIGLALYALCVWPANIHHFTLDMAKDGGGLGLGYHVPRMIAQPVLIWLALWVGGATNWPLRRAP
ncbi:MAG: DoxX family protein [Sphingomonadaceae bacterium]